MNFIDRFLNSITMYKLVLYSLQVMTGVSVVFAFLGILSFSGISLVVSFLVIMFICTSVNYLFAKGFQVPTNVESTSITAYILFLILDPIHVLSNGQLISWIDVGVVSLISAVAIASKYLFTYKNKHLFNPAAIGLVVGGLVGFGQGTWWVSSAPMLPIVLICGLIIVRKIRRFSLFVPFLLASSFTIIAVNIVDGTVNTDLFKQLFFSWPIIFLGTVMLTEPYTAPGTKIDRAVYGVIVGMLFGSQFHIGNINSTPELALVIGNLYSFIVNGSYRMKLTLLKKEAMAPDIYEFSFRPEEQMHFFPGQYLEWTLAHKDFDSRGIRRYFTVASSPTEEVVKLGVKTVANGSSFKHTLTSFNQGDSITISQLGGDFTLPEDESRKLVFIAGGIGVTPFRSMVKYLIDTQQQRDIILFYAAQNEASFVYKDIFAEAERIVGLKVIYVLSGSNTVPAEWKGIAGIITPEIIEQYVPDFSHRTFYLSGPDGMVKAYKQMLKTAGVGRTSIRTDYFPGF